MGSKRIALLYLAEPRYGGWVSYTAHLFYALRAQGHQPYIFRVSKRSEQKARPFGAGCNYWNVSPASMEKAVRSADLAIVVAADKSQPEAVARAVGGGASLVVHDPAEMKDPLLGIARRSEKPVVTIRSANVANLRQRGIRAVYVPHPYVRANPVRCRKHHAVAYSRLDWDKHTDIICRANRSLPASKRVAIYGAENRLYTHHQLEENCPGWRDNYHGRYPNGRHAGALLAAQADYAVDMSIIAGDGDGTQYTFLEAWDAGCVLVVHEKWVVTGKGAVQPGKTALAVKDAEGLVRALARSRKTHGKLVVNGQELLRIHEPAHVVPEMLSACVAH